MSNTTTNTIEAATPAEGLADLLRRATSFTPALLDAEQAAAYCGVSRSHFLSMDQGGRLGPQKVKLGSSSRWSRAELEAWAAAGCPVRVEWAAMKEADR
ncbi:helix-turn-helix transcriptional regulator [Phycisphaerales bacterium AB-hyl4]|uniref:Helix-turn-helix transcriptional regulator n=1 Tax=Natronomicrosphaera hydrolytica TaxID=3242702 RepID=A0ABV4UA48_9BACT